MSFVFLIIYLIFLPSLRPPQKRMLLWDGGDNRDRTDDPLLAKQVLSQLSYTPIFHTGSVLHLLFEVLFEPQKLNNDFFQEIL